MNLTILPRNDKFILILTLALTHSIRVPNVKHRVPQMRHGQQKSTENHRNQQ
jgi:hypothetical protein